MVLLIVCIKTVSMTGVMTFFRINARKALMAAVGLCQIGELALIFMIKAHASELVSRRTYLLFVNAISVFLACSSIFNRRVVLARRRSHCTLPSTIRDNPVSRHWASRDADDLHAAGSSAVCTDSSGEEKAGPLPSMARRQHLESVDH